MTATAARIAAAMSGPPWTTALCRLRPQAIRTGATPPQQPPKPPPPPPPKPGRPPEISFGKGILDALHLDDLDTGDLLLLFLLFFLFKQKADEELLIAIGLLLIL